MSRALLSTREAHTGLDRAAKASSRIERLVPGTLVRIARDPCHASSYRLRGPEPWPRLCRISVATTNWRIVYAFGPGADELTIIAIGRHDETPDDVYEAVAMLLGAPPVSATAVRANRERCCQPRRPRAVKRSEAASLGAAGSLP